MQEYEVIVHTHTICPLAARSSLTRTDQQLLSTHSASAPVLVVGFFFFFVIVYVFLLFCVDSRFSFPALVLYYYWVETFFLAPTLSPSMYILLLCFVIVVKRSLLVAAVVLKLSNGKIIHLAITCLLSSVAFGKAHDVLQASLDWTFVFSSWEEEFELVIFASCDVAHSRLNYPLETVFFVTRYICRAFYYTLCILMGRF
jgi:hypothetical protein